MTHTMDLGSGWTQVSGSWTIQGNAAKQGTNSPWDFRLAVTDAGKADVRVSVQLTTASSSGYFQGGVVGRYQDASNYWRVDVVWDAGGSRGEFRLYEINGGVETKRVWAASDWTRQYAVPVQIDVEFNGNVITACINGGYQFTYTSSFLNATTNFGIFDRQGPSYGVIYFDNFEIIDLPVFQLTRRGTVISPAGGSEVDLGEPTVIYESDAKILSGTVFKMWFGVTGGLAYAESTDGITWTRYGSLLLTGDILRPFIIHSGSTYYLYYAPSDSQVDLYTSPDGLVWTVDTAAVLAKGEAGAWDADYVANTCVWVEGSTWYMLYEARGSVWHIGLATASDPAGPWTKSGSNPVFNLTNATGGPNVFKIDTYYYCWLHESSPSGLPTIIKRYRSTDLVAWEPWPHYIQVMRIGADEGGNSNVGQSADCTLVVANGTLYIFYDGCAGGDGSGHASIKLITTDARALGGY